MDGPTHFGEREVIKGVIKWERGIGPGHKIYALLGVKHYDYESHDYESHDYGSHDYESLVL